jgi:hypothetical protein
VLPWAGALAAPIGIAWLAPLMLDQLVLFGDRQQLERAAAARTLMPAPAVVLIVGATMIGVGRPPVHAAAVALPLVAVMLALIRPDAALSSVAYGNTAPVAVGALLATTLPARGRVGTPAILLAIIGLAATIFVMGSLLAVLGTGTVLAWWALSRRANLSAESPRRDRR